MNTPTETTVTYRKGSLGARLIKAGEATPGPWYINAADGRISIVAEYADSPFAATKPIAVMTGENREANAALIKHAPFLVMALEDLLAAQDWMQHASDYLPGDKRRDLEAAKQQARAALALVGVPFAEIRKGGE